MMPESQKDFYLNKVANVIKTDAIVIDKVNFLATHTPFKKLTHVRVQENIKTVLDEESFFQKEVMGRREDHQFIIVQGDNGTGKSHFIRWVKERYKNAVSPDEEAVIFISRSESTLRGALKQIINSGIFNDTDTIDNIKKLVSANEHLSLSNLKDNIIHQFAIAVQNNLDEELFPNRMRKNLYAFLVDDAIREFLFEESGPIERIRIRMAAENSNQRLDDVSPRFEADDFIITIDMLSKFKKAQASNRAMKLAETLFNDDNALQLRKNIAQYLNGFLETVVQTCANIRGSDLEEVFKQLRKELKKDGKNLTLFIEDITSFTGIDRAMVDVLTTNHEGENDKEGYCRLLSLVGITNEYYQTTIPDSIKERVTGRVLMDDSTLFNGNQISEMTARYLNALYVDRNELENWVANGAHEESLPISNLFAEQKWATYHLNDQKTLTLFPFNHVSLANFYHSLDRHTPRRFLQHVLTHLLIKFFADEKFPPKIADLVQEFPGIPNFTDPTAQQIINNQASDHRERISSFLRIWGNGTLETMEVNEKLMYGGLPEEAFHAFGLPTLMGKPGKTPTPKPSVPPIGDITNPEPSSGPTDPKPKIPENPGQPAFDKLRDELDKWFNASGKIKSYANFREDIHLAYIEFVDWESEGISSKIVSEHFISKRIAIEGSSVMTPGSEIFEIEKSNSTFNALLALAAWRHLGKKSWDFTDSVDYLPGIYNWLTENKDRLVAHIKYPNESIDNPEKWELSKWTVLTSYYISALSGNINRSDSKLEIYKAMLQGPDIKMLNNRSNNWTAMQKRLNQTDPTRWIQYNYQLLIGMYNRVQGKITASTRVHFLDAAAILKDIDHLNKKSWNINDIPVPKEPFKDNSRYYTLSLLTLLKQVVPLALEDEKTYIDSKIEEIWTYLGSGEMAGDLFNEMREILIYFKQINEGYRVEDFKELITRKYNHDQIISQLDMLKQISELKDNKLLLGLMNCPIESMIEYLQLFQKMDTFITKKQSTFEEKNRNLQQKLKESETGKIIENTRKQLIKMQLEIEGIHQEVSYVNR